MTDAVDTVLRNWAIPRMNVRHMLVARFNVGSVRVFLRNGFQMKATYEDHYEVKGNAFIGMEVLRVVDTMNS